MHKSSISILFFCLFTNFLVAQDPVYSQFYASPMQTNPALAGSAFAPRIVLNYRNQWPNIPNAYATYSAAYDQYLENINSGIGFSVLSDKAGNGIYTKTSFAAAYSYNLQIDDNTFIRTGLDASVVSARLNWNQLVFLDQIDPVTGVDPNKISREAYPDNQSVNYVDFSAGLLAYTKGFYGGLALQHLTSPDESILNKTDAFGSLPVRITLQGGAEISLKKDNKIKESPFISPNILFVKQGKFYQVNLGAYVRSKYIFGGLWFRHTMTNSDAIIMSAGVQASLLRVGYSYDLTVSKLAPYTGGAHEVSLIINFQELEKKKKWANRYNNCLKMFK